MSFYELTAEMDDTPQDLMIEAEDLVSQLGATTLEGLEEKKRLYLSLHIIKDGPMVLRQMMIKR